MVAISGPVVIIGLYLLVFLAIGAYEARKGVEGNEEFFLASRDLGSILLLFTVFATILSSFSYFGGPGLGYSTGLGVYSFSIVNLFLPIPFLIVGIRVWKWTKDRDIISPVELMEERMDSKPVGLVFLTFFVAFTIPYIALQPLAGGIIFDVLSNGVIPQSTGVLLMLVVITLYVLVAGLHGVALTDTFQAVIMFFALYLVFGLLIFDGFGGLSGVQSAIANNPDLFTNPGPVGYWSPHMVFSWIVFFTMATIMFPQVLVRFMATRNPKEMKRFATAYAPIVVAFYIPIALIGAFGAVLYPGLGNPDQIIVEVVTSLTPPVLSAVILGGALAALISTADSQILALSQMLTRDGYVNWIDDDASGRREAFVGRAIIIVLGILGGVVALINPSIIARLGAVAFAGLSVLFPSYLAALFVKRVTAPAMVVSIILGEVYMVGSVFGYISASWSGPFHYAIPGLVISVVTLVVVTLFTEPPSQETIEDFFGAA